MISCYLENQSQDNFDTLSINEIEAISSLVLEHCQKDVPDPFEYSLIIMSLEDIHKLNYQYRKIDKPTNVISFENEYPDTIPLEERTYFGDIFICPNILKKEALEQNKNYKDHFIHILVHGLLHILGYDHIADDQREQMEALEITILDKLNIKNPYICD